MLLNTHATHGRFDSCAIAQGFVASFEIASRLSGSAFEDGARDNDEEAARRGF
jgi:hypothetical protein